MGAARRMRKSGTLAEDALWQALRRKALGWRVRRQYTCGDYVLDFYVHAARLAIEVDGPLHDEEHDRQRDFEVGDMGILTLRIPADEIPAGLDVWVERIDELCRSRVALLKRMRGG
jgi:very-short-patch-repair endonuclease